METLLPQDNDKKEEIIVIHPLATPAKKGRPVTRNGDFWAYE
jgi:hypothetical protein